MKLLLKYQWSFYLIGWTTFAGAITIIDRLTFQMSIQNVCIIFWIAGLLQIVISSYLAKNNKLLNDESQLKNNNHQLYETLFNIADDTIFIMDVFGKILMINITGARRVNKLVADMIGKNAFDYLPEKTRKLRKQKFDEVIKNKKAVRFTDERQGIVFDQIMSPVFDHTGKVKYVAIYARDITDLKKIEKELKTAQESAEKANKAKSILLTHVSHELRTPLNVILGYTQLLNEWNIDLNEHKKDIELIHKNTEYLIDLIDDIFDLSSIDASKMKLLIQPFKLNDLLSSLPDLVSIYSHDKNVDFKYHFDKNLPKWVKGDLRRLRQILLNLLVNALKFTDKGHVFFSVINQEQYIEFKVEDSGIGIPKESIKKIFEPFCRLTNKSIGAGLGLSITKLLVEKMGGEIHVESSEGKGSSFWFNLKLESVDESDKIISSEKNIGSQVSLEEIKTVLVVDDLDDNRGILIKMLEPLGFNVLEANSGESALGMFSDVKPDIMLVDLIMPGMDGFELIKNVKINYPDIDVKAIAISASFTNYSEKNIPEYVDGYMSKPVRKMKLIDEISKHVNIKLILKNTEKNENNKNSSPTKILRTNQIPDKTILEQLIDFANHGNLSGLKKEISLIEKNSEYSIFVDQIKIFMSDFNFDALIDYIFFINQSNE